MYFAGAFLDDDVRRHFREWFGDDCADDAPESLDAAPIVPVDDFAPERA